MTHRRHDLDWLRLFGILIVFLYHGSRFFNIGDWHVKNINLYPRVEMWNVFATRWMMPLFFIISGASLYYALEKTRGWRVFYTDKLLRLMTPVLIASVTHAAFQVYLERLTHGQFSGSIVSFAAEYFNGLYMDAGMPGNFAFHGMHLWYLLFLFLYGLLCYHLFVWLKGGGREILDRITTLFAILGLGMWFAPFKRSLPRYANEGVLPFYILHQTVLLAVGWFVLEGDIHDALKWAIISTVSFILILAIYFLVDTDQQGTAWNPGYIAADKSEAQSLDFR